MSEISTMYPNIERKDLDLPKPESTPASVDWRQDLIAHAPQISSTQPLDEGVVKRQPVQRHKHKCDGARPDCLPYLATNRRDCAHNTAGNQRSTFALEQRIYKLEKQSGELKDVIISICTTVNKNIAIAIARQLAINGFHNIAEVAEAFRRGDNGTIDAFRKEEIME
ncbi:hypothetical protein MPH_14072 [Macrophomina phaseolina MS6]|uniref:Uncharacterized protein n=1 Tax=Macrophomina phaseolina (strain MS6) TaxID=1126212 RepID=K2RX18_MACPH|nr:hypothetical protein MPH_14072 [Macrophomina phaseolina MS6]